MFDIYGDEITFRGIHFATIDGKAWPTLRDEAKSELAAFVSREETDKHAYAEFERGEKEGYENGQDDLLWLLKELHEAIDGAAQNLDDGFTESAHLKLEAALRIIKQDKQSRNVDY